MDIQGTSNISLINPELKGNGVVMSNFITDPCFPQNDTNSMTNVTQNEAVLPISNLSEQDSSVQHEETNNHQAEKLFENNSDNEQEDINDSPSQENDPGSATKTKKKARISDEDRKTIIKYHLAKHKPTAISKLMGINFNSVRSVINVFQKTGRIAAVKGRTVPQKSKLTDDQKNIVKTWLVEDCNLTLTKIKDRIKSEFDISVSVTTCFRMTGELQFSLENLKEVHKQALQINEQVNACLSHPQ